MSNVCSHVMRPEAHIVHVLPGRVRFRFSRCCKEYGARLGARFGAHPDVRQVAWAASARSLTVHFDPRRSLDAILQGLPPDDGRTTLDAAPAQFDWGRILVSCLLALLPLGPAGNVALTLAQGIVEEWLKTRTVHRLALPPADLASTRLPAA